MNRQYFLTVLIGAALLAPQSSADDAGEDRAELEEVLVTGSRIMRRDLTAHSPIITVDSEDLALAAQPTLEETLNKLPQFSPNNGRTANYGDGTAALDLRGMGAGRTLVMLDARRFAPSNTGNAVDINNLPQALIERVEIITGGVSTVYGSDALAGVVNFITKKDFQGLVIDAGYGVTDNNDGTYHDFNLSFGSAFAGGRGNATVFAGYYERDEIFASDRSATKVFYQENYTTGTLIESGSRATPQTTLWFPLVNFGSGPEQPTFNPDGSMRALVTPDDLYNFQSTNYMQLPMDRLSIGAMINYTLPNGTELYFESLFAENEVSQELAPAPLTDYVPVNLNNPNLHPETAAIFADSLFILAPGIGLAYGGRRFVEAGPRHISFERDYWRTLMGARHTFDNGWTIDGWAAYTTADEIKNQSNGISRSRVRQGLLVSPVTGQCFDESNGCVPVDIFGAGRLSAAAVDFIRVPELVNKTDRIQQIASIYVAGSLFDGWAGPVDSAFGIEWRKDEVEFEADDYLFTGDALGYSSIAPVSGDETVTEAYAEVLVPLVSDLNMAQSVILELGARFSDYEHAGGVWSYKAGGQWQFNNSLSFRAMYQRSVRAPNNRELLEEQYETIYPLVGDPTKDRCSASQDPIGNGFGQACILQGLAPDEIGVFEASIGLPVTNINGGNPDLEPEEAETLTVGFVITPEALPDWSFTVDYYKIEITDEIGGVDPYDVCFDPKNRGNVFCNAIERDETGNIAQVTRIARNRGFRSTRGFDVHAKYETYLPDSWSLPGHNAGINIGLNWNHMLDIENQENAVSTVVNCTGYFNSPCAGVFGTAVDNRAQLSVGYVSGPLSLNLILNWIDSTENWREIEHEYFGGTPKNVAVDSAGSRSYVTLSSSYRFNDRIAVRFGINNLTDTDAPFIPNNFNTDYLLYDVIGRSYSLSLSMTMGEN